MDAQTIDTLNQLNRRFYEQFAASFSKRRQQAWSGWARVLEALDPKKSRSLSVLDLGCGNGRFGRYLLERWPGVVHYLGLDRSAVLLEQARAELARWPTATVRAADFVTSVPELEASFDLVVAFGLLHHLPGLRTRLSLVRYAAGQVRPSGLLAITFWQFALHERFTRRFVPWSEQERYLDRPVAEAALEPGDHLLRWGDGTAVRYCHHSSEEEIEALLQATGLEVASRYPADGRSGDLNHYAILQA